MEEFQFNILLAVAMVVLVSFIFYLVIHKRETIKRNSKKVEEKQVNRRDNFRLRINMKDSLLEVLKVGSINVNQHDYCEIVDISAGGVGIISYLDFTLKQNVYVRVHFYLNEEAFSLNGRIVRKIERINRNSFLYGIQFLNLSTKDENRLIKEIVALENQRRKMSLK
ncbi:PilZ domain-containing protein [Neobacillus niacini]|uniref:PilZ domain-containing protein n=1 Tax=Neobacillus niacini TaxID=86668 RepID=UPI0005EE0500|nr:PilZ domain-containing protein [Neobacillus niacini]